MTNEILYEAVGDINDKYIEEAKQVKRVKQTVWLKWGALAACLCIIAGLSIKTGLNSKINNGVENAFTNFGDEDNVEDFTTANTSEKDVNLGITLSVKDVTPSGLTLVVTQSGGEPTGFLHTGEPYRLAALVGETWQAVEELPLPEGVDGYGWNSLAYNIPLESSTEFEIDWSWIYGELPAGRYRLEKGFMDVRKSGDYDTMSYTVEFTIE